MNHDGKGLEFDHYPDHQKITLKWVQVEQHIDLMIQSDRYLTDKEKEHYTPPAPVSAKPDGALTHAKNLIRDGLTLEQLAEKSELSSNYIGMVERGLKEPGLATIDENIACHNNATFQSVFNGFQF